MRETREFDLAGLVTNADLAATEAHMMARVAEGGRTIMPWTVGLFLAEIAIIAGLLKFFSGH